MSGKILIVDDIATNRIVLKVKLSAACYEVSQATTAPEAMAMVVQQRPHMLLVSAQLAGSDGISLIKKLRADPELVNMPMVLVCAQDDRDTRLTALRAGADDVLCKPLDDMVLLARLRSLMRARYSAEELRLRDKTNLTLGFGMAEAATPFAHAGEVAIIAPDAQTALNWRRELGQHCNANIRAAQAKDALRNLDEKPTPDVFVVALGSPDDLAQNPTAGDETTYDFDAIDTGLRLLADIRARAETRHAAVMVVLPKGARRLAADALDLGANDLMTDGFDAEELALRLTAQIEHKRVADRLRASVQDGLLAAVTDPLTGLYNRRYAMPHLERMASSAAHQFAVMVLDLDHFKDINDTYGHAAGDDVLVAVANALREGLRVIDLVARIGGEEFLIVMPETSREAAKLAATRICEKISALRIIPKAATEYAPSALPIQVTASIGVAIGAGEQNRAQADDVPQMLSRADQALYAAKTHGRNQVTFAAERSAA